MGLFHQHGPWKKVADFGTMPYNGGESTVGFIPGKRVREAKDRLWFKISGPNTPCANFDVYWQPTCQADPEVSAHATRDANTGNVRVYLRAHRLGNIASCGAARLAATTAQGTEKFARVQYQGSSATGSVRLKRAEVCEDRTLARVRLPYIGAQAKREATIPNSIPRITGTKATRKATGAESLTVVAKDLLPTAYCHRPQFTFTSPDGTDPLPVTKLKSRTATASATLPKNQDCAPSGTVLVVQRPYLFGRAKRTVTMPGPFPPSCPPPH